MRLLRIIKRKNGLRAELRAVRYRNRWLSPDEIHTLEICEGGRAIRSNYTSEYPQLNGWRVHWKALDVVIRYGLVMRVGKYYCLTEAGRQRLRPNEGESWDKSSGYRSQRS